MRNQSANRPSSNTGFMKSDDESIGRAGFRSDARNVDGEKGISDCKGRALVAVEERMVLPA